MFSSSPLNHPGLAGAPGSLTVGTADTPRRRLVSSALLALLLLLTLGALPAFAGDLRVQSYVQGAGTITYSFGAASCNMTGNLDERVTQYCGQRVNGGAGSMSGRIWATPAASPPNNWQFVRWENCPNPSGNSCYMEAPFLSAGTFAPKAIFDDTRAPTITLGSTSYPGGRSVTVPFSVDEPTGAVDCQLDGGGWTGCQSGGTTHYGGLSEGGHTLRVRAADKSGQQGYSEVRSFTIVDTQITGTPDDPTGSPTGTFTFTSVAGSSFECRLDDGSWADCSSPSTVTVPTDGAHTFRVKAVNGAVEDPDPAEYSWRVDTTAPETALDPDVGPAEDAKVESATAEFAFSSEAGATFACRFDSGDWASCTSPYDINGLTGGRHTFEVRASDSVGNTDAIPARRSWVAVVDQDGDGSLSDADCNDADPSIHPGAVDTPEDGIDENCDGVDGVNLDHDGDGNPRPADCNDNDPSIHVGAIDEPENGVDENCDGKDAVDLDRDHDGYNRPQDCNDADPAINPGAVEVPGNAVDEDCTGGPAPYSSVGADVRVAWRVSAARTQLLKLQALRLPAGSKLTVQCHGKRRVCPFRAKRLTVRRARAARGIAGRLRGRWLTPGTRITVRITKPGTRGMTVRFVIRRGKAPTRSDRCVPATASDRC